MFACMCACVHCMSACMCACVWTSACMRVCIACLHKCVCVCGRLHACVCALHVCMQACVRLWMSACMRACMVACVHGCMHACLRVNDQLTRTQYSTSSPSRPVSLRVYLAFFAHASTGPFSIWCLSARNSLYKGSPAESYRWNTERELFLHNLFRMPFHLEGTVASISFYQTLFAHKDKQ